MPVEGWSAVIEAAFWVVGSIAGLAIIFGLIYAFITAMDKKFDNDDDGFGIY